MVVRGMTALCAAGVGLAVASAANAQLLNHKDLSLATALTYRQPSLNVEKRLRADPGDQLLHLKEVMGAQGGLPVVVGGDTIGSVAVSGSPGGDKDEACAKAGLDKVADQLK